MIPISKKYIIPIIASALFLGASFKNDFWNSKTDRDIHNLSKNKYELCRRD
jgi:hypothetical protein